MGNSLVECLECHSMYHQNCHNPPIIDINLNDPRIVWYCINCRQKDSQKTVSILSHIFYNSLFLYVLIFLLFIKDSRSSGKEGKKSSSKNASKAEGSKSGNKSSQGKLHKSLLIITII